MRAAKKKTQTTEGLALEVKRLRRDVDLLRIMDRLDNMEARLARLEFRGETVQD